MPPKATNSTNNRNIKDFFKPFTIPKSRIPRNDIIEDEIIVAAAPSPHPSQIERRESPKSGGRAQKETSRLSELSSSVEDGSHSPNGSPVTRKTITPRADSPRSSNALSSNEAVGFRHPGGSSGLPQLDGTLDDPLLHISPPGSQQRALSAVEIPSPQPRAEMLPPIRKDTNQRLTASFSSISTLSSAPPSSQSSSRRIVKNGIQAVTNSDSGSDDSSDSEELADIYSFVPRKRQKLTPPEQESITDAPSTVKPARRSARVSDEAKRVIESRKSLSPPRMVYKHSLAKMVKQRQKEAKTEVKLREAEEAFEASLKQREQRVKDQGLDDGLKAAVADDSDQGERMKLAMARTELLQEGEEFRFFRGRRKPTAGARHAPPADQVFAKFPEKHAREQACTSGLLVQFSSVLGLSEGDQMWIAQQLTDECRHDLCMAYVEILRASRTSIPVLRLQDLYHTSPATHIEEESDAQALSADMHTTGLHPGLQYVLDAVRVSCVANVDSPQDVVDSLTQLIVSALDHNIQDDAAILQRYQDTIARIVDAFTIDSRFEELCRLLLSNSHAWQGVPKLLQCRAVASIPALSARCHALRRLLAAHLVTDRLGAVGCSLDLDSPRWNTLVLQRLNLAPEFAVTDTTDYSLLTSLVNALDIAIDAGFSDHTFESRSNQPIKALASSAQPSQRATEEASFNAHIDAFTKQLRSMSSRIRDAGSSHLKRTEAKMAIDRLILRLEWCVRTKPKPKKQMFGDNNDQQRSFLSGFLKKASMHDEAYAVDEEDDFTSAAASERLTEGEDVPSIDGQESVSVGPLVGKSVDG